MPRSRSYSTSSVPSNLQSSWSLQSRPVTPVDDQVEEPVDSSFIDSVPSDHSQPLEEPSSFDDLLSLLNMPSFPSLDNNTLPTFQEQTPAFFNDSWDEWSQAPVGLDDTHFSPSQIPIPLIPPFIPPGGNYLLPPDSPYYPNPTPPQDHTAYFEPKSQQNMQFSNSTLQAMPSSHFSLSATSHISNSVSSPPFSVVPYPHLLQRPSSDPAYLQYDANTQDSQDWDDIGNPVLSISESWENLFLCLSSKHVLIFQEILDRMLAQ
ncbi:hypothetical protein QCA50_016407 [Cerrena zonata]|uniref:Uncharacterized protein n=1 Tax=Cerrena zonata TaxID=2478898 RepID=A0AAW0FGC1_9APHY